MEDPASQKIMLKGYPVRQKMIPSGPNQATICDELGVRMCCFENLKMHKVFCKRYGWCRVIENTVCTV